MNVRTEDHYRNFNPNIINNIDRHAVNGGKIAVLVHYHPYVLLKRKVKELGFNPKQIKFVLALKVFMQMIKLSWEKVGIYRSWGWLESLCIKHLKDPFCMLISEDKLTTALEFYVNELGVYSSIIAENPQALHFSLEGELYVVV